MDDDFGMAEFSRGFLKVVILWALLCFLVFWVPLGIIIYFLVEHFA